MMKKLLIFLTIFVSISQTVATELNCVIPKTVMETTVCKDTHLKELYLQMQTHYTTLQTTPSYFYLVHELVREQQSWEHESVLRCESTSDSKRDICIQKALETRINALENMEQQAQSNVAVIDNNTCSDIKIVHKIVVDNAKDICSKYSYLDVKTQSPLSHVALNHENNISAQQHIFEMYQQQSVIKKDHCTAYRNQEIFNENIVYINPNVISFQYFGWTYTGGAHGNGGNAYLNYDRNDGSVITWETLFKNNRAFENYVSKRVKKELVAQGYLNPKNQKEAIALFKKLGNFSIRSGGLYIEYGAYDIAPYASGYPSLLISKKSLKKYMSKQLYRRYFVNDGSVYLNLRCKENTHD